MDFSKWAKIVSVFFPVNTHQKFLLQMNLSTINWKKMTHFGCQSFSFHIPLQSGHYVRMQMMQGLNYRILITFDDLTAHRKGTKFLKLMTSVEPLIWHFHKEIYQSGRLWKGEGKWVLFSSL